MPTPEPHSPTAAAVPQDATQRPQAESSTHSVAGTPTPTPELAAGSTLGPYRLLSKLGEGGMGAVYKAQHTKLEKIVAIKVLPAQLMQADSVARFEREMKAVGKLNHPNIVQAHDAGEIAGTHYLAMEYVDGSDLQKLVKDRGPFSVVNACKVLRQAAQALSAAHGVGLIHRDIKPSNLLVAKTGQIKLLDLGLARLAGEASPHTSDLTAAGQVFGTPDYMAPEQWHDAHAADARTDLYALGCTLFFLLTGRAPYGSEQYRSVANKMKGHVIDPIPNLQAARADVPAEVVAIYQRLLAKEPADRFPTAAALVEALAPFTSSKTAASSPPSRMPHRRPPTSLHLPNPRPPLRSRSAQRSRLRVVVSGRRLVAVAAGHPARSQSRPEVLPPCSCWG